MPLALNFGGWVQQRLPWGLVLWSMALGMLVLSSDRLKKQVG